MQYTEAETHTLFQSIHFRLKHIFYYSTKQNFPTIKVLNSPFKFGSKEPKKARWQIMYVFLNQIYSRVHYIEKRNLIGWLRYLSVAEKKCLPETPQVYSCM